MTSKTRWTLNPKKWFGTTSHPVHKRELNKHPLPPLARTIPRLATDRKKMQVIHMSTSHERNNPLPVPQLQLPAFSIRRERTSISTTMGALNHPNTFHPAHTEPTIRKNGRLEEQLAIDTTRCNVPLASTTIHDLSKVEHHPRTSSIKPIESNVSHRCLIDYPTHTSYFNEESSLPTRSSSSSLYDDSTSSGIYTDERQRLQSKETLSTLEVLSVESITDSQMSLNQFHARPIIHHFRRPMSVFEISNDEFQQRQTSLQCSVRSHSAEDMIKETPPILFPNSGQSSGLKRISNDTYRLIALSPLRPNSLRPSASYNHFDELLRPAEEEECYAMLPQATSTEQLSTHIHNDLQIILNECIHPMINSVGKNRSIKARLKRSQMHPNADEIAGKLLSSVDCSIYTRYQRCD